MQNLFCTQKPPSMVQQTLHFRSGNSRGIKYNLQVTGYKLQVKSCKSFQVSWSGAAAFRRSRNPLRPKAETSRLRPKAETSGLRPKAETSGLRPKAKISWLRPKARTVCWGEIGIWVSRGRRPGKVEFKLGKNWDLVQRWSGLAAFSDYTQIIWADSDF